MNKNLLILLTAMTPLTQSVMVLTALISIFNISSLKAQAIVWDPIVQTTMIVNHLEQNSQLKEIKTSETKIATAQAAIAVKMEQIRAIEEKVYKSLKSATIVIQNVKDIGYAYEISSEIGKYQSEMGRLAKEKPELLVVAARAEVALLSKGADLLNYIIVATTATDANLMNNEQRIRIIRHVVDELRIMRGMAYSIVRQMRYVAMNGFLNNMNFLGFRYQRDAKLVKQILEEFKKR
jgi:hypothetical protein